MSPLLRRLLVGAVVLAGLPAAPAAAAAGLVPVARSASGSTSFFTLRNAGPACRTSGVPVVRLLRDGHRLPVERTYPAGAAARLVPTGALVSFSVQVPVPVPGPACAPADTVRLALGEGAQATFWGVSVPVCLGGRVDVSGFRVLMAH